MKTIFVCTIFLLMEFSITSVNIKTPESIDIKLKQKISEDFNVFFEKFCFDENFQISRIKFPLMFVRYNEEYTKLDTLFVKSDGWVFRQFYFGPTNNSYGQIYDNFEHKLRDSDERVFAWNGIGNGIKDFLYFKRINGLWFLIKEEDLSS